MTYLKNASLGAALLILTSVGAKGQECKVFCPTGLELAPHLTCGNKSQCSLIYQDWTSTESSGKITQDELTASTPSTSVSSDGAPLCTYKSTSSDASITITNNTYTSCQPKGTCFWACVSGSSTSNHTPHKGKLEAR